MRSSSLKKTPLLSERAKQPAEANRGDTESPGSLGPEWKALGPTLWHKVHLGSPAVAAGICFQPQVPTACFFSTCTFSSWHNPKHREACLNLKIFLPKPVGLNGASGMHRESWNRTGGRPIGAHFTEKKAKALGGEVAASSPQLRCISRKRKTFAYPRVWPSLTCA